MTGPSSIFDSPSSLHRRGLKVIYYISPQLWAWRPRRVSNIKRDVDLLLSILPFEVEWYKARDVDHVEFVGHPLSGEVKARFGREEFCRRNDLDPSQTDRLVSSGQQDKGIERILPPMIEAIEELRDCATGGSGGRCGCAEPHVEETRVILSQHDSQDIKLVQQQTREALAASDAAAIASGTATLEAALLETPMVVVYKESPINWHTLGRLITVPHFGLVNLVAGKEIAKELMQDQFTAENLVARTAEASRTGNE